MTSARVPFEITLGDGLVLKKLHMESAAAIFEAMNSDRQHLRTWLPFVDHTWKASDTEIFIQHIISNPAPKKDIVYEIWHENDFAGLVAIKEIDPWNRKAELGYWITSRFEGRGFVSRSCRMMIKLAFDNFKLNRIQIKAGIGNIRSCLIPERLGFRIEGIERDGERLTDRFTDLVTYSLLRDEWIKNGGGLIKNRQSEHLK